MTFVRPEFVMLGPLVVLLLGLTLMGQWRRLKSLTRFYSSSAALERLVPVSYTHLTLPTSDLV